MNKYLASSLALASAAAVVALSAPASGAAASCFGASTTGGWDPVFSEQWWIAGNGRSNVGVFAKSKPVWVDGRGGDDKICTGGTNDELLGDSGIDAPPGNDKLDGGAGADELWGYAGRDVLRGGPGADLMNGGAGRDVCIKEGKDTLRSCEVVK